MSARRLVLDHGYVELIESWGSDERIVEAARMSTAKGFLGWGPVHGGKCKLQLTGKPLNPHTGCCELPAEGDERLLKYLWANKHTSPFELAGAVFEVQAPIFVLRQWHRHRTWSYNEHSARYGPLPDLEYVPTLARLFDAFDQPTTNRQAKGGPTRPDPADVERWLTQLRAVQDLAQGVYQNGLDLGLAPELARLPVPVTRYSRMRGSANLLNLLKFISLRSDAHAQWEIRQFSDAIWADLDRVFPRTLEIFRAGFGR